MEQVKSAQYLVTPNEREYLAKLCWLLNDAGTYVLRVTFDSIHPPLTLRDHLMQTHIKSVLVKLHQQNVLKDKQWKILYPPKKKGASSQKYDTKILIILLETVCHLCPPYPNGWNALPLATDNSLSADIVRLQILLQQIGALGGVRHEEYPVLWKQIVEVLLRLGGPPVRVKIQRIDNETVPPDMQTHYIQLIKDTWGSPDDNSMRRLRQLDGSNRRNQSSGTSDAKRHPGDKPKNNGSEKEGLPLEDKAVIMKTYKLLVDTVIVEDIIDRLQQGQVIKISDRQEILAQGKNSDRMQTLLEKILTSKIIFAFKLLCDAIKFKYPRVYDIVMKTRKATYKQGVTETIDLVGVCQDAMAGHYKTLLSRCAPFPWSDNMLINIRDTYTTLDIVDIDGKKQHMSELLPVQTPAGRGKRIVIEGSSGSGNSTMAAVLTYIWSTQRSYFKQGYTFLLYIDAQAVNGNLNEVVYKQALPENTKIDCAEFWSLMEANARDVVVLVDGFDESTGCAELNQIIQGTKLRHSAVLLFVHPELQVSRYVTADYKLFNLGLSTSNVTRCLKSYAHLSQMTSDDYESLLQTIQTTDWELKPHLASPFVCLMLFAVYQDTRNYSLLDITTLTGLFEHFNMAMATGFCKRQNLDVIGSEFPEEINKTINQVENFAFHAVTSKKRTFTEQELFENTPNAMMTKLGVLEKNSLSGKWKFTCSMMMDFLAARHLADMILEDMSKSISENKFLKSPRFAQLISFTCGLFRKDYDTPVLETLFLDMIDHNYRQARGITFKDGSRRKTESDNAIFSSATSGHVINYSHSLQSLSECNGRDDVTDILVESIPRRLLMRKDGLFSHTAIHGLSSLIQYNKVNVTHVEINLLPVYMLQPNTYFSMGKALSQSPVLKSIKIFWWSLDLMARFICLVTKGNRSLETLHLEDCSKKPLKQTTAATWADIQEFCNNISDVKTFIFLHCRVAAVVGHLIHHLPATITKLDFTDCSMNLMCAGELSAKLEHSKNLKELNLSFTNPESSELTALAQGLKLSESLVELNLSGTRLDRSGIIALAESIKLTTGLQCLDISSSELTTEMCKKLANAISENHSLNKLVLSNTKMTCEGRLVLTRTKVDVLQLIGLDSVSYMPVI